MSDNDGRAFTQGDYAQVTAELTDRFGGLTAFTRSPADGVWKDANDHARDDSVIVFEVMVPGDPDEGWWRDYRRQLEALFRQQRIVVRAQAIRLL